MAIEFCFSIIRRRLLSFMNRIMALRKANEVLFKNFFLSVDFIAVSMGGGGSYYRLLI